MFTLKVENKNGQILELTQNETKYQIVNIGGLNPPEASIFTHAIANMDGQKYKSSKLQMRNIVLTVAISGDVEQNRLQLYEFFRTGSWCKIYYSNSTRSVFIEGYCENFDGSLFEQKQKMQISIVCPDPYFKSLLEIYSDISKQFPNFEFPFDIDEEGIEFSILDLERETTVINAGEISCGLKITLTARSGNVAYPIIYNVDTGEFLSLHLVMQQGDIVVIDTTKGKKSVKKISNATETNVINSLESGSTWFQLKTGATKFTYDAEYNDEGLKIEFESNLLYEGV